MNKRATGDTIWKTEKAGRHNGKGVEREVVREECVDDDDDDDDNGDDDDDDDDDNEEEGDEHEEKEGEEK